MRHIEGSERPSGETFAARKLSQSIGGQANALGAPFYSIVANNPVSNIDLLGLQTIAVTCPTNRCTKVFDRTVYYACLGSKGIQTRGRLARGGQVRSRRR